MANTLDVIVNVSANIAQLQGAMNSAAGYVQSAGDKMRQTGQSLTLGVTAPLVGLGVASVAAATTFNTNLANVASLGVENVETYKHSLEQMAVDLGTSTTDLSAGLYDVVSAFGVVDNSMFILKQSAIAGKAGLATTQEAMSLLSAVTKGYGDTSSEAVSHASDLAFTAVRLGQTTFPDLASAMGRVVPLTATLGVRQEELFNVMATATGVTGGAAEVSTQMRQTLQALLSPTKDMTALIKDQGYASGEAMIAELGYMGAMQNIVDSANASNMPLQKYIAGIEGQTLALALTGNLQDQYVAKMAEMENVNGATTAAFEAQTQGVNQAGFAMDQAKAKMQVFAERLGEGMGPAILAAANAISPLVDALLELAEMFSRMPAGQQLAIVSTVAAIAAVGPALMVLGSVVSGAGALLGFLGTLAGIAAAIVSPLGLLVGGLIALGGAILYFDVGGIGTGLATLTQNVLTLASTMWQARGAIGDYIMAIITAGPDSIEAADALSTLPQPLQDIAAGFSGSIAGIAQLATDVQDKATIMSGLFTDLYDAVSWIWQGEADNIDWWYDITASVEALFNMEPGSLDWLATSLFDAGVAAGQFKTDMEAAFTNLGATLSTAYTNVEGALQSLRTSESWVETRTSVVANATDIWTALTGAFSGEIDLTTAWTNIQTALTGLHTDITAFLTSRDFATFTADISSAFGFDTIAATINENLAPITEAMTTFGAGLQPAIDVIQAPLDRLATTISTSFSSLPNLSSQFNDLIGAFGGLGEAFQNLILAFAGDGAGAEGGGVDWNVLLGGASVAVIVGALNGLNSAIQMVGVAFSMAVTGMTLSIGFLTGMLTGFTQIIQGIQDRDWSQIFAGITTVFTSFKDYFTGIIAAMSEALTGFTTAIGGLFVNTLTDMGFDEAAAKVQTFVDGLKGFFEYINGLATGTITVNLPIPSWLENLQNWVWPEYKAWLWPDYLDFTWPDYLAFTWPDYKLFEWPEIKMPDWVDALLNWRPFGGGGNQLGTGYWRGGVTRIGEMGAEPVWFSGPQYVNLPRGARIMNNSDARRALRGAGGAGVTINATVRSDDDLYRLAQMLQDYLGT